VPVYVLAIAILLARTPGGMCRLSWPGQLMRVQ